MDPSLKGRKVKLLQLLPYTHQLLRCKANTVEFPLTTEDKELIASMLYSVEKPQLAAAGAPGGSSAGMAAPQWGVSLRIFIIQRNYFQENLPRHDSLGGSDTFAVVINPDYVSMETKEKDGGGGTSKEVLSLEGCFSVPHKIGLVRRYETIKASFSSLKGEAHELVLTGWPARVFQHETDHTNGLLYDDVIAGRCVPLSDLFQMQMQPFHWLFVSDVIMMMVIGCLQENL